MVSRRRVASKVAEDQIDGEAGRFRYCVDRGRVRLR